MGGAWLLGQFDPCRALQGVAVMEFRALPGPRTVNVGGHCDWCRAWSQRARVHEDLGREALARGQYLSAGAIGLRHGIVLLVFSHFAC
jgi:hypothetical protein